MKSYISRLKKIRIDIAEKRNNLRDLIADIESEYDAVDSSYEDVSDAISSLENAADLLSQHQ